MSLILHMKIPGAIVVASDCRVTGTEKLYIPVKSEHIGQNGKSILCIGNPEEIKPQKQVDNDTLKVQFGHYNYVNSDNEQKTFLLITDEGKPFAISYCGEASMNGYPTSYRIKKALADMTKVDTTNEIAEGLNLYWNKNGIESRPSLFISGYNVEKSSILEVKADSTVVEHFEDEGTFGITYNGDTAVTQALINMGDFSFSLFRLQDAIDFCGTLITTTAQIQRFQNKQQTVSKDYDLLVISGSKAKWVKRATLEFE